MTLQPPKKYLYSILSRAEVERDITKLTWHFIKNTNNNLHFIINETQLNVIDIICSLTNILIEISTDFIFKEGQKLAQIKNPKVRYSQSALKSFLSPFTLRSLTPDIKLYPSLAVTNLKRFIPITPYKIERAGNLVARIASFQEKFNAQVQYDFINNHKLLVVGNRKLFCDIPKEYPSCFVSSKGDEEIDIEYNSPILPKIAVLKNINLLEKYQQQEVNGSNITFSTCIFIGNSKFENSINIIRNYYHQHKFEKAIFIGEKDIKINLGNNQMPLRWKWTIPEIKYLKRERAIEHKHLVIENNELEKAITEFYDAVKGIESKHTISLKQIYRFIHRLYYDWNLKQETTLVKLQQIQREFDAFLKQLLIETIGNIFTNIDLEMYQKPLALKFAQIINAIKMKNKSDKLKTYQSQIRQLVLPSFLCDVYTAELNEIVKKAEHTFIAKNLQAVLKLHDSYLKYLNDPLRNFYCLTANGTKAKVISLSKSDDAVEEYERVLSSIYGSGKIERLIEKLAMANFEYKLLLYSTEEAAFQYHQKSYRTELNKEYASPDRFEICGVNYQQELDDNNLLMDEWVEAISSPKYDYRYSEFYQITFQDNKKIKLPSTKSVLKLIGDEKEEALVEELSSGDTIQIYVNPDKETLRVVFELKYPDLLKRTEYYSQLWQNCLFDFFRTNLLTEERLFLKLVENRFSVSIHTLRRYLKKQVFFPARYIDLIAIAKTVQDERINMDIIRKHIIPTIHEFEGKLVKEGLAFSEGINHYLITGEINDYLSQWYSKEKLEIIAKNIETKTIKSTELIAQNNDD